MMNKKEKICAKVLLNTYKKALKKYVKDNTKLDAKHIVKEYEENFFKYMYNEDMGSKGEKFSSYLNIYSGLASYELLIKNGLSPDKAIEAYDMMSLGLRNIASLLYKAVDLLPNGYLIVKKSVLDDLVGEKACCWDTKIIENTSECLTYQIDKCLYYDVCKNHGYPEFCKVFCKHDICAYGVLKRHTKFIRKSTIAEGGDCCYDTFKKVK